MRIVRQFILTVAALTPIFGQGAPWNAPAFSVSPAALRAAADAIPGVAGVGVTLFLEARKLDIDGAQRAVYTTHRIYRIEDVTRASDGDWTEAGTIWEPWRQKRPVIRARVITTAGQQIDLDPKTLSDTATSDQRPVVYDDDRYTSAPLPKISVGAIVEELITLEDTQPLFAAGMARRYNFGYGVIPTVFTSLTVTAPLSVPLRYATVALPAVRVVRSTAGGKTVLRLEQAHLREPTAPEDDLPGDVPGGPSVRISTGASWNSVAAAYAQAIAPALRPAPLDAMLAGTAGLQGDALLDRLLSNLHHLVRYTGLEFGRSGLIPNPPQLTLQRGFGDCKDKATVLVASLRALGLPASLALLRSRQDDDDVSPGLPGLGNFDHAIVYIAPGPGRAAQWLDATAEFYRPGALPAMDQGRLALVIQADTSALTLTPVAAPADNLQLERREIRLAAFGPAAVTETTTGVGDSDAAMRDDFGHDLSVAARKNLEAYVGSMYLAKSLTSVEHGIGADLTTPFALTLKAAKASRGITDLEHAVAAIRPAGLVQRFPSELVPSAANPGSPANAPPRMHGAHINAFATEWEYTIVPPAGYQAGALPQDRNLALGPAHLSEKYKLLADGSVAADWHFDTGKADFSAAELKAVGEGVRDFANSDPVLILFTWRGAALRDQGRVADGLAADREVVAHGSTANATAASEVAIAHLHYAEDLLTVGFGDVARAQADLALQADPKLPLAYQVKGELLEHDGLGRKFATGFDLSGALAAFRAGLALDPSNTGLKSNLAFLLEYDAAGDRYAAGAQLEAAAIAWAELAQLDKSSADKYAANPAYDLFYSGHFAEAAANAAALPASDGLSGMRIAVAALTGGIAAANTEAARLTPSASDRASALQVAGNMVLRLRRYPVASALMAASAQFSAKPGPLRASAQVLANTRPFEQIRFPPSDPRSPALGILALGFDASAPPTAMLQYAESDPADRETDLREFAASGRRARSALAKDGLPVAVFRDIWASGLKIVAEGNDHAGYRLHASSPDFPAQIMVVVKTSNGYRLIATTGDASTAGDEVLRRLDAHDFAGARSLLDWLRELQPAAGGDDPLGGDLFPHFWNLGDPADPARMRLAAITLRSGSKSVAPLVPTLRQAEAAAKGEEKVRLEWALAKTAATLGDWDQLRTQSERLLTAYPASDVAFAWFTRACAARKDWAAWQGAIDRRLHLRADDSVAQRSRISLAEAQGDFTGARQLLQARIDQGQADTSDRNRFVWDGLFLGSISAKDVAVLEPALNAPSPGFSELHTLACAYAEMGKGKEAYDALLRAMDVEGADAPDSAIWYVLGRLAESYGLTDVAASDYAKVTPTPLLESPTSVYSLAQIHLRALRAKPPAQSN